MTSIQKKMLAIVVIAALVSTIGYGVYHYATQSPNVKFTTVNFKVNYNGNFSNYLEPSVLNTTNPNHFLNDSAVSNLKASENSNGVWQMDVPLTLWFNNSSKLYQNINAYGYGLNDSVVVQSIVTTTPGFSSYLVKYNGNAGPFPYIPLIQYTVPYQQLIVNINTMSYHGPLNVTINVTSPAQNILIYRPNLTIQYDGNSTPPTLSGGLSLNGLALPSKNTYVTVASGSLNFSVELIDQSNFTVTGITVSKPFSVPSQSYSEPGQGYSEQNGTRTYSGPYVDVVSFSLIPPKGPFSGNLNITIQVR